VSDYLGMEDEMAADWANAREKLPPMVTMSAAIRNAIYKASGVSKLSDIPDDHLEAYAEIVTAFSLDFHAEIARRGKD
jgi:hypothetical protein